MGTVDDKLQILLAEAIVALDLEFVGYEYIRRPHRSLLRIYIDKPGGITLGDCAMASRHIGGVLDVEDIVRGQYDLEVSSPGLERPLFTLDQYSRFIGQTIQVKLQHLVNGRRRIQGILIAVEGEIIIMEESGQRFEIPYASILKAHIVPSNF